MLSEEQACGTCRHVQKDGLGAARCGLAEALARAAMEYLKLCSDPLPAAFAEPTSMAVTPFWGTRCPAWQGREASPEERRIASLRTAP